MREASKFIHIVEVFGESAFSYSLFVNHVNVIKNVTRRWERIVAIVTTADYTPADLCSLNGILIYGIFVFVTFQMIIK